MHLNSIIVERNILVSFIGFKLFFTCSNCLKKLFNDIQIFYCYFLNPKKIYNNSNAIGNTLRNHPSPNVSLRRGEALTSKKTHRIHTLCPININ